MKKRAEAIRKNRDKIIRQSATNVLVDVAKGTPYDTGRAKYNWITTKNAPAQNSKYAPNYGRASGHVASIFSGVPVINSFFAARDKSIHIVNNLRYIDRLNMGHSRQAAAGYVQRAVVSGLARVNFKKIFDK